MFRNGTEPMTFIEHRIQRRMIRRRLRILTWFVLCQAGALGLFAGVAAYLWWSHHPLLLICAGLSAGVAAVFWHLTWQD